MTNRVLGLGNSSTLKTSTVSRVLGGTSETGVTVLNFKIFYQIVDEAVKMTSEKVEIDEYFSHSQTIVKVDIK